MFVVGSLYKQSEIAKIFKFADEDEACEALDNLRSKFGEHVVDNCTGLCCVGGFYNGVEVWGRLYNQVCGE
jgi:hypothetical protein